MDEVVFDGIKFVKAAVAAKKFRYTSDYIGQLCRAKKVNARLVGRSWYVDLDSLVKHRQERHSTKPKSSAVASISQGDAEESAELVVKAVGQTEATKESCEVAMPIPIVVEGRRSLSVSYEVDDEQLLPKLVKKYQQKPSVIPVDPAEAKSLAIKAESSSASFHTTAIPTVSLSGELSLTSYPDVERVSEDDDVVSTSSELDNDKSESVALPEKPQVEKQVLPVVTKEIPSSADSAEKKTQTESVAEPTAQAVTLKALSIQSSEVIPTDFKHRPSIVGMKRTVTSKVSGSSEGFQDMTVKPENEPYNATRESLVKSETLVKEHVPTVVLASPLIATVVALAVVLLIMSAVSTVVVSGDGIASGIELQIAGLLNIFQK